MSDKLQKYGVIGQPISHSKSPQIFNYLFDLHSVNAYYSRILFPDENLIDRLNLSGFNITSPYKSSFLATTKFNLIFHTDIKSINAVIINNNVANCYNYDFEALKKFIKTNSSEIKNALIIGSGDTALTAAYLMKHLSISTSIYARNRKNAEKISKVTNYNILQKNQLSLHYDLVISTISNVAAINIINKVKFDYLATSDYFNPIDDFPIHFKGIDWLIEQAKPFYHKITGKNVRYTEISNDILADKSKNIIHLTGFMGAGKSTIGKILADKLKYSFIDIDDEIERQANMSVKDIFITQGEKFFRDIEEKLIINVLDKRKHIIISSGGGSITNPLVFSRLKEFTYNIYLSGDLTNLFERSKIHFRPLHFNDFSKFKELFSTREDLYFSISDLIVNADIDANELVNNIYEDLHRTI